MNKIDEITQIIGEKFRSFGGGQENPYNPVSMALKDQPFQFAAGVDIKAVVETVLNCKDTPAEDQPSEPDKVKPLAQYLDEYVVEYTDRTTKLFAHDTWQQLLEQALDAYESTEQVKIRIERI